MELGKSRTRVVAYENGDDIMASTMAHISAVLGFPMKEYVTEYDEHLSRGFEPMPIDRKFKELIRYARIEKKKTGKAPRKNLPPKPPVIWNEQLEKYELGEVPPRMCYKTTQKGMNGLKENKRVTAEDDQFFYTYLTQVDITGKSRLIDFAYNIILEPEAAGCTESSAKAFAKAVISFVSSDADERFRKRLRAYAKTITKTPEDDPLWRDNTGPV